MLLDRFRSRVNVLALATAIVVCGTVPVGFAADAIAAQKPDTANQPWAVFWVSSLGRTMAACDLIFEAADRAD